MFHPHHVLQPSWSYSTDHNEVEDYNEFGLVAQMSSHEFSSISTTPETSISQLLVWDKCDVDVNVDDTTPEASITHFGCSVQNLATILSNEYVDFQVPDLLDDDHEPSFTISTNHLSPHFQELNFNFMTGDHIPSYIIDHNEGSTFNVQQYNSTNQFMNVDRLEMYSNQPNALLNFPYESMEIDHSQQTLLHLLMAYGEAMQNGHRELAQVIVKRVRQTVSPVGEILERLVYYLFDSFDKQSVYLKSESKKNFQTAFNAFYQIFPYGKFAHFAANSTILEAMPKDAKLIHIFDFDIGDGVQWSSVIEAIAYQKKDLRITSIKWNEGDEYSSYDDPLKWKFEETKRRLHDHARLFDLNLMVEEMELHGLNEVKTRGSDHEKEKEWCVFNCMVSLPHMARLRSRRNVNEFLRMAKECVTYTNSNNSNNYKGIVTFGDGDAWGKCKILSSSFTSFLDGHLIHYQSLLESVECNLPVQFREAKTAMQCLFIAPFVSSVEWIKKWEETRSREYYCSYEEVEFGLESLKVSKERLMEAKEMVREGESLYGVSVEGDNQMVLDWRGNELVRVSCWQYCAAC